MDFKESKPTQYLCNIIVKVNGFQFYSFANSCKTVKFSYLHVKFQVTLYVCKYIYIYRKR